MIQSEMPLTLTHCEIHRILRAGACPILEVTVTYPRLGGDEDGAVEACPAAETFPAAARFNEAYGTMAQNLTEWATGSLFESALADFNGEGSGAAYRFDRRLVICDMVGEFSTCEDGVLSELTVNRTLRLTSRRGSVPERHLTATDRWSLPALTLRPRRRRTMSI